MALTHFLARSSWPQEIVVRNVKYNLHLSKGKTRADASYSVARVLEHITTSYLGVTSLEACMTPCATIKSGRRDALNLEGEIPTTCQAKRDCADRAV